jgi:hypothetical protein
VRPINPRPITATFGLFIIPPDTLYFSLLLN